MIVPNATARAFNKAVSNPENINQDGSINWNFVDADTYMVVQPTDSSLFLTNAKQKRIYRKFITKISKSYTFTYLTS